MEEKKIFKAIPAIMAEVGAIEKKGINGQGWKYRGVDQVMTKMNALLSKHGVFVVPEVIATEREKKSMGTATWIFTKLTVKYHFYADDGSEVCAVVEGEAMDGSDKSCGKALSYAYKSAFFQVFSIPTEEVAKSDPDAITPDMIVIRMKECETTDDLALLWDSLTTEEKKLYQGDKDREKVRILSKQTNIK